MPTDGNSQANTDQNENNEQKVTFTPEQQARIDEIVRESMGRAARETRTELETTRTQLQTLQAELNTAKEALRTAKTPTQKSEAKGDIEALQNQINEMKTAGQATQQELERLRKIAADKDREIETAKGESLNVRKEVAMQKAASKVNFVDTAMVTDLTQKFVKYDDTRGKFIVVNAEGQERLNSAYEPMSLDEFYAEFASKNPFLVRGDVRSGVGSTESQRSGLSNNGKYAVEQIFGKNSNSALANKLAMSDPKEYQRLKAIARENGLL